MGKKTDYKKMWRREKQSNGVLHNENIKLKVIIDGQIETITGLRDGKIKPKDLMAPKKVISDVTLLKVLEESRRKQKEKGRKRAVAVKSKLKASPAKSTKIRQKVI